MVHFRLNIIQQGHINIRYVLFSSEAHYIVEGFHSQYVRRCHRERISPKHVNSPTFYETIIENTIVPSLILLGQMYGLIKMAFFNNIMP